MAPSHEKIVIVTSPELTRLSGLRHGFFGRSGGLSGGVYRSLNCGLGSNDVTETVKQNRARVLAALEMPSAKLCTLYQCHTPDVVVLKDAVPDGFDRPKADALVSNVRGSVIGILTADCTPVLFADVKAGVIGAAHAGWKGAIGGVLQNTVKEMEALGASRANITAAIGPCIRQPSYEVGPEFRETFLTQTAQNARYFIPSRNEGKYQFDMAAYVQDVLNGMKLGTVGDVKKDTLAEADHFFSYRRTCLAGEKDYGRQISAIALT